MVQRSAACPPTRRITSGPNPVNALKRQTFEFGADFGRTFANRPDGDRSHMKCFMLMTKRNMRLLYVVVLVAGLVLPARAEEDSAWSFSGSFSGSSNSDGTVLKLA